VLERRIPNAGGRLERRGREPREFARVQKPDERLKRNLQGPMVNRLDKSAAREAPRLHAGEALDVTAHERVESAESFASCP